MMLAVLIENEREEALLPLPEEYETLEVLPAGESMCDEPITPSLAPVEAEAPVFWPALNAALAAEEPEPAVTVSSDHTAPPSSLNPAAAERSQSPPLILSTDAPAPLFDESECEVAPALREYVPAQTVPSRPLSFTPMLPNMRQPFSTNLLTWWLCRNSMYDTCSTSPAH